jgi:hypothetical protein
MNTMLRALKLGNFKAFAETQNIPIRRLTLIFGANSAGKSSILHGLLYAREALESGKLDVHKTSLAGDSVDLGGFKQFIHRHKRDAIFLWGAELESEKYAFEGVKTGSINLVVHIFAFPWGVNVSRIEVSVLGEPFLKLSPRAPVMDTEPTPFAKKGIDQGTPSGTTGVWINSTRFLIEELSFELSWFSVKWTFPVHV